MAPTQSIRQKVSRYDILEKIAESGFAVVYKGRDPQDPQPVAIKICVADDENLRRRFLEQAELAAPLRHPNIASLHEFGSGDGQPYLVEEFSAGEDLRQWIHRNGTAEVAVGARRELRLLIQIASALDYAHRRGVLHQDLKPATIHLEADDRVKVVDFGIARLASAAARLGPADRFRPPEGYLSPEQAMGLPADARTDIFCFGALAFELISRRPPFAGASAAELLRQTLEREPPLLSAVAPGCPPALAALVARCLARNPGDRYPSFEPIVAELRAIEATASPGPLSLDDTMAIPPDLGRAGKPEEKELVTAYIFDPEQPATPTPPAFPPPLVAEAIDLGEATASTTQRLQAYQLRGMPDAGDETGALRQADPGDETGALGDSTRSSLDATSEIPTMLLPASVRPVSAPPAAPQAVAPPRPPAPPPALPVPVGPPLASAPPAAPSSVRRSPWRVLGIAAGAVLFLLAVTAIWLASSQEAPRPAETPASAPPPAPAAAPATGPRGRLVVAAVPWAEVASVKSSSGQAVELPAGAVTPLALELAPGVYQVTLRAPQGGAEKTCQARVETSGVATCRVEIAVIPVAEYFAEAGWWK